MSDIEVTTESDEGYKTLSTVSDHEVHIDAGGADAPSPVEMLVTTYTSCFLAAFRMATKRNGIRDVGRIEIDAVAEQSDDGLESTSFTLAVEADLDDPEALVEAAEEYCHVNNSLEPSLRADVTVEDGAF
ncbi:OsmC family protein [Halorussus salilacus]|uniref:OsmC family protein n=1 Tax=Halorussus salilacus TaxID=2953750 RepID=UPI00209D2CEC|nr:OsmC family protein [Halorussus salilacus]USZ66686.1 OsmC family protein [Halorussus salilacus]